MYLFTPRSVYAYSIARAQARWFTAFSHISLNPNPSVEFSQSGPTGNDETWRKLQGQLEGNTILRGQDDSAINTSLRYAEISRTPADLSVCIAEKVATKQRWLEPVKISNPQEIFDRSRDQISHLEETIDT